MRKQGRSMLGAMAAVFAHTPFPVAWGTWVVTDILACQKICSGFICLAAENDGKFWTLPLHKRLEPQVRSTRVEAKESSSLYRVILLHGDRAKQWATAFLSYPEVKCRDLKVSCKDNHNPARRNLREGVRKADPLEGSWIYRSFITSGTVPWVVERDIRLNDQERQSMVAAKAERIGKREIIPGVERAANVKHNYW